MKKMLKTAVSMALALMMLITPSLAIIAPEDAAPNFSERQLIDIKARELLRSRMHRSRQDLTDEEISQIDANEQQIVEEMKSLGAREMSSYEVISTLGYSSPADAQPMVFEYLEDTDLYRFFVSGPYTTRYEYEKNKFTNVHYIEVLVVPMEPEAVMWVEYGNIPIKPVGTLFGTYKDLQITTYPTANWTTLDVPADMFPDAPYNESGKFSMDFEIATLPKHIYFTTGSSSTNSPYTLGFITCAVECYETLYVGDTDLDNDYCYTNGYKEILDENYDNLEYALYIFFGGGGINTRSYPMTVWYYLGGQEFADFDVQPPYPDMYYPYE